MHAFVNREHNSLFPLSRLGMHNEPLPATVGAAEQTLGLRDRSVALRIDPLRTRRLHYEIVARLVSKGARVAILFGRAAAPLPPSVDLLVSFERLVYQLRGPRLSDSLPYEDRKLPRAAPDDRFDIVLDLCGDDSTPTGGRTIRPLYDGVPGEAALIGALLAGRMPVIDIEDVQEGAILARGAPCADNSRTILEAFNSVLARVATLAIAVIAEAGPLAPLQRPAARSIRLREMLKLEASSLARAAIRRLYHLCCYAPHWRTCWRIVNGNDLWTTRSLSGVSWNVVPDPGFRFYADPFPFLHEDSMYVFVEDFDHRRNKGVISVIPFGEHGPLGPAQPVLEEPWHLSYPFLLAHQGQIWMIPESSAARTVDLYRADPFPHRWVREATLLAGIEASDATLVRHAGRFWMFAATRDGAGSWSDTLSLFSAADLHGPWEAHPGNPVLVDKSAARPAGAMVLRDARLWRPVQDCSAGYGTGIGLAEVTRLDGQAFSQTLHQILHADPGWPGRRFHTLNCAGWLECIDGSAHSPRSRSVAGFLEHWSGRRDSGERCRARLPGTLDLDERD